MPITDAPDTEIIIDYVCFGRKDASMPLRELLTRTELTFGTTDFNLLRQQGYTEFGWFKRITTTRYQHSYAGDVPND